MEPIKKPALSDPAPGRAPAIAFVCGDQEACCELPRALQRALGQVSCAGTLRDVEGRPSCSLAMVHYDSLSPEERRALLGAGASAGARRPLLLLSAGCTARDFSELFGAHALTNLLVVNGSGVDLSDLLVTVEKFRRQDIFGLEKYFGWGVDARSLRVTGTDGKQAALDEVAAYAARRGVVQRLCTAIRTVADELLTNAIYNAPVTADGHRRFAAWPRTRPVRLDAHEAVELRYCCDGRRLGVSVTDPFGSLAPSRLQDHLARAFRGGADQVSEGAGGAGLGFYQVFDSLSHFIANIEPGVRTEMIGLLDVSGSYRAFASAGKSFNIFVKGASL